MKVRSIGYIGVSVTDLEAWRTFAGEVLGLQVTEPGDGRLLLKMDDYQWRIAVHAGAVDNLAYAGFELPTEEAWRDGIDELRQAGFGVELGDADELKARGVGALAVTEDPAGNRVELYCRPTLDYSFASPVGTRFVTGALGGYGLGHVVLLVAPDQFDACSEFYRQHLGFRVSEQTMLGPVEVVFLHCNARHHSVALAKAPISWMHHFMIEAETLDDVGRALDRATDAKVPISATLGRHRNDEMVSFYMRSPGGFEVEFGFGARLVDDATWSVTQWTGGDVWGHRGIEAMVGAE